MYDSIDVFIDVIAFFVVFPCLFFSIIFFIKNLKFYEIKGLFENNDNLGLSTYDFLND